MQKLSRPEQYKKYKKYIESEKLASLFDWQRDEEYLPGTSLFIHTESDERFPFPPHIKDLIRLHKIVRSKKPAIILEFGVGYSTIVMADALHKNGRGKIFSVDASEKWVIHFKDNLPAHLADHAEFLYSEVKTGTFAGQLCHYYTKLPDVVPDFIYLDGPNPRDVQGQINGLTFQGSGRTPVAADCLLMEPTLLPGTYILVDGRTNNVRFLARNFKRDYAIRRSRKDDVTTFELLGRGDLLGLDFYQTTPALIKWLRVFFTRLYAVWMMLRSKNPS